VTWAVTGVEAWGEDIQLSEVSATIAGDAAAPPPWEDIEPAVVLDTSYGYGFFRSPVAGHSVDVNLSHSSFRFPPGWPPEVRNYPEQGAGGTFSRASHYLEFKGWGARSARVAWQSRESADGGTTWSEWGEQRSARLALRVVEIEGESWLRSEPLPEDPLPDDYLVPLRRQIRLLSMAAAE
jgi:hypothetical protein